MRSGLTKSRPHSLQPDCTHVRYITCRFTVVSPMSLFPDSRFPNKTFPGKSFPGLNFGHIFLGITIVISAVSLLCDDIAIVYLCCFMYIKTFGRGLPDEKTEKADRITIAVTLLGADLVCSLGSC